jgi:protein transport protein SEC24
MDTTIALVAKESARLVSLIPAWSYVPSGITQSLSKSLRDVRDALTDTCVKVLLAYRKHCASATSPGQVRRLPPRMTPIS